MKASSVCPQRKITALRTSSGRRIIPSCLEALEQRIAPAVFLVTNTADSGTGSLRQAILDANALGNQGAADEIRFAIDGTGVLTIRPLTPLPAITDPVIIDGYSQPGASPNTLAIGSDAVLRIELDGSLTADTTADNGLRIDSGGSTVRGLIINRFHAYGVAMINGDGNTITGNWIGPNSDGLTAVTESTFGVLISDSSNNLFGGATPAARNVVAGNVESFEIIGNSPTAGSLNNRIVGNYFGVGKDGVTPLGNDFALYTQGIGTIIGGFNPGEGNVISNTKSDSGILVDTALATGTVIQGNIIGLDATGTVTMGNAGYGIDVNAPNTQVGGSGSGGRNIISSNTLGGIVVSGNNANIRGNYIGTDITGAFARPNSGHGIEFNFSSAGAAVGEVTPDEGNVIAFNTGDGVHVDSATGISIRGNSIFSNGGLGINLGSDGVTPNDTDDSDTGANGLQNFPVLVSAVPFGGSVTIMGTLTSVPGAYTIDFFVSNAADSSGHGEGKIFFGSIPATVDAAGNAVFTYIPQATLSPGSYLTATATDGSGNTSEFSAVLAVGGGEFIWDGGGGADTSWFNPLNWDRDNGVPGAADIATLNIDALVTIASDVQIGTLNQSSGTITGTATLNVLESFIWSGGTQSGAGVTLIDSAATLEISGAPGKVLYQRTLEMQGTALMTGTGTLNLSNGASILNSGIFDLQSDGDFLYPNDGSPAVQFSNLPGAILRKSAGTGMSEFGGTSISFNNSGWVDVQTGTLRVQGLGGTGTSPEFSAEPGAVFEFSSGVYSFSGDNGAESSIFFNGGGLFSFTGATVNLGDAYVDGESGTRFQLVNGALNTAGSITFDTGARLEQSGGTLGGTGTLRMGGTYHWTGGIQSGNGVTQVEPAGVLEISGATVKTLSQRSLELHGSTVMSGAGSVTLSGGAFIANSGTFELQSDGDFLYANDGTPAVQFINLSTGILRKAGSMGVTEFNGSSITLNNAGTLDLQSGTLFATNLTHTAGTIALAGGALGIANPLLLQGGQVTGAGTITGNVANSGAIIRPGGTGFTNTITIAGDYSQSSGGMLAVELNGTGAGKFDVLAVTGTATLGGTLDVSNLGAFSPGAGHQFRVVSSPNNPGTFATVIGQAAGLTQTPDNAGLVLVGNAALPAPDLVITSNNGVTSVDPGSALSYTLQYRNDGARGASGVEITEILPAGTSFNVGASTAGWTETAPGSGIFKLFVGTLPAGGSGSVTFAVTVNSAVTAGQTSVANSVSITDDGQNGADVTPADNAATETDTLNVSRDLQLTISTAVNSATPGSTVPYQLSYQNIGNQSATGVILTETLPAGTAFNPGASTAGWTETSPGSGVFKLNIGTVPGGTNNSVIFAVTVNSVAAAGQSGIANSASIADDGSGGADPTPANNTANQATALNASPDLAVSISDGLTSTTPGSLVTYTVAARNQGNQDATGVVLTMQLPVGTTYNAGASTAGWTESAPGSGIFTFAVGALAGGTNSTVTFAVVADAIAPAGRDSIVGSVSIADDGLNGTEPTPLDNIASDTNTLDAAPDLVVTVDDGLSSTTPGSSLSYTLSYNNQGNQNATGVVLTQTLPAGMTFNAGASTAGWSETSPGSGVYQLAIGALAGSASGTATFAVTVPSPAPSGLDQIATTATIGDDLSNGTDPNGGNNTATDSDTLNASPDLQVTIQANTNVANRGGLVSYTLEYANAGDQNSSGVYLTHVLPAHTSFNSALSTPGWSETSPGSGIYHFDLGNLTAGAQGSVIFAVKCATALPAGFNGLVADLSIGDDGANGADPTPQDNTASETVGVYQGVYILAPGVPVRLKDAAPPTVQVFDIATGQEAFRFDAYEATYRDSVRIAVGDINGDGFDDIITAKRTGTGQIRVFDGLTGSQLSGPLGQIDPFDGLTRKTRGAFVTSGDVTGDGRDDIIAGSALGGGTVNIYDGVTGALVTSYQPFGAKFKGGVRVATGDVDGDGADDVIVGQGLGGSRVKVFDGTSSAAVQSFRAGPRTYTGGIFVASGDFDGDGKADILTGRDLGSSPLVQTFSGIDHHRIGSIMAFNAKFKNGVRVSAADVNLDGIADIIATSGTRNKSQVTIFDGNTGALSLTFAAFPEFPDSSLFVAASTTVPVQLP